MKFWRMFLIAAMAFCVLPHRAATYGAAEAGHVAIEEQKKDKDEQKRPEKGTRDVPKEDKRDRDRPRDDRQGDKKGGDKRGKP